MDAGLFVEELSSIYWFLVISLVKFTPFRFWFILLLVFRFSVVCIKTVKEPITELENSI